MQQSNIQIKLTSERRWALTSTLMLRELVPLLLQCSSRDTVVGEGAWGGQSLGQLIGKVMLKLCSGERFTQGKWERLKKRRK
jgi:hypothetical protein